MTSLAFLLCIVPLTPNSGAGSGAQNALCKAVIRDMLSPTVLAIFFVPLFFVAVMGWFERRRRANHIATVPANCPRRAIEMKPMMKTATRCAALLQGYCRAAA